MDDVVGGDFRSLARNSHPQGHVTLPLRIATLCGWRWGVRIEAEHTAKRLLKDIVPDELRVWGRASVPRTRDRRTSM